MSFPLFRPSWMVPKFYWNSSTNPEQEAGESMFVQLFETEKDFYFAPWYGMIVIKEVWVNV